MRVKSGPTTCEHQPRARGFGGHVGADHPQPGVAVTRVVPRVDRGRHFLHVFADGVRRVALRRGGQHLGKAQELLDQVGLALVREQRQVHAGRFSRSHVKAITGVDYRTQLFLIRNL